mgnify:CR=1 FL=1
MDKMCGREERELKRGMGEVMGALSFPEDMRI